MNERKLSALLEDPGLRKKLADILVKPMIPVEAKPIKGSVCRKCGSRNLKCMRIPISPYGGSCTCKDCGFVEDGYSYICRQLVIVEPIVAGKELM